jgi:hypothetical protein
VVNGYIECCLELQRFSPHLEVHHYAFFLEWFLSQFRIAAEELGKSEKKNSMVLANIKEERIQHSFSSTQVMAVAVTGEKSAAVSRRLPVPPVVPSGIYKAGIVSSDNPFSKAIGPNYYDIEKIKIDPKLIRRNKDLTSELIYCYHGGCCHVCLSARSSCSCAPFLRQHRDHFEALCRG